MQLLKKVLTDGAGHIERQIILEGNTRPHENFVDRHWAEHRSILDQIVKEYIDKKEPFLRETFRAFFCGNGLHYDVKKSRYYERDYMHRILKFIRDVQETSP